jgi:hypothetical protein
MVHRCYRYGIPEDERAGTYFRIALTVLKKEPE